MKVCVAELLALCMDSGYKLLQLCQCERLSSWIKDPLIQQVVSKDLLNTHTHATAYVRNQDCYAKSDCTK